MDLKNPTRTEALLANIAGYTGVPVPDMKNATRSERLLKEILDNGGGGGGDVTKEYVDTAIANAVADIDDDISALSDTVADKVDKENGKSLSTNDYTDADKALVQDSPITTTATGSDLTLSTSSGNVNAITVYGKSEVVDGAIKSAGEGWATVDLGTLTWLYDSSQKRFYTQYNNMLAPTNGNALASLLCTDYTVITYNDITTSETNMVIAAVKFTYPYLNIRNTDYTDATAFKTAMSGVILAYQLADPTQGNAIAVKTDDGSGINATMAVFTTGTPLRGIPDTDVRDVMAWDGSAGTVTKNYDEVDLGTRTWMYSEQRTAFNTSLPGALSTLNSKCLISSTIYTFGGIISSISELPTKPDKTLWLQNNSYSVFIKDSNYTDPTAFKATLSGVKLIYELATPITTPLTSTENASIAGLRTFAPTTHAQNNAGATMTIEAYAGTANGKAVAELKSELQITQSDILTLTVAGWNNNTQTVTYEHDTGKRNSIDVEPANIKAWTAAGILATAETASTITFECDTVPTADLSFRVTSMEVR